MRVTSPAASALCLAALLGAAGCAAPRPVATAPDIVWSSDRAAPQPQAEPQAAAPAEQCREYTQTVTVGGEEQQAYGRVCRQPDGTWRIMPLEQSPPAPPRTVYVPTPVYPAPVYRPYYGSTMFFGSFHRFGRRHPHYGYPYRYPRYW